MKAAAGTGLRRPRAIRRGLVRGLSPWIASAIVLTALLVTGRHHFLPQDAHVPSAGGRQALGGDAWPAPVWLPAPVAAPSTPARADTHRDAAADDAALREMALTHPALLLELIGATPALEAGRFAGYRVADSADPALLAAFDLEPGDTLVAVNGAAFSNPDQAAELLGRIAGSGPLAFTVRRGNEIRVLAY